MTQRQHKDLPPEQEHCVSPVTSFKVKEIFLKFHEVHLSPDEMSNYKLEDQIPMKII